MKVSSVDLSAINGRSYLHRLNPVVKLLLLAAGVAFVIVTWNSWALGAMLAALLVVALTARLNLRVLLPLMLYPLIFTALFALSSSMGINEAIAISLKGLVSACLSVMLIMTTPYPVIFGLSSRVLPRIINDALFLSYRAIFILGDLLNDLMQALKLRGNMSFRHPIRSLKALGSALGTLALQALDLSSDDYDVLHMRGYDGHIVLPKSGVYQEKYTAPKLKDK